MSFTKNCSRQCRCVEKLNQCVTSLLLYLFCLKGATTRRSFQFFFAHVRQHDKRQPATGKDLRNETEEEISKKRGQQRNHKKEHKMRNMMKHESSIPNPYKETVRCSQMASSARVFSCMTGPFRAQREMIHLHPQRITAISTKISPLGIEMDWALHAQKTCLYATPLSRCGPKDMDDFPPIHDLLLVYIKVCPFHHLHHMSRDFLIDKRIYQEVDIDHCGCRHFPWGRRRA